MKPRWGGSLAAFAMLAGAACASAPPPRELLDARASYARAAASDATRFSPSTLHDAKVALDNAESSFRRDADSDVTRDKAYVAIRKAELAEVVASTELLKFNETRAEAQTRAEKDQAARGARGEFVQAREQLATAEQRLEATGQNVGSEKKARAMAELKAREALDKLAVANTLAVKDEPRGTVIIVPSGVLFAAGKSDLLPGAQSKLEPVAEALSQEQDHQIVIEGHTDSQGLDAPNLELSQRRAQIIRDFFVSRGAPKDHVTATGVGEARPIADNATAEGRANNRRVEIVIQPIETR